MSKPRFDPSKPYEVAKPKFDPSKPYEVDSSEGGDFSSLEESGPSRMESALRGGSEGITFGFQDELSAYAEEAIAKVAGGLGLQDAQTTERYNDLDYSQLRDTYRDQNKVAERANPGSFLAGQFIGGGTTAALPGLAGASTVPALITQGALQGLGSSEADLTDGSLDSLGSAAVDTAVGGGFGAGLGMAVKGISKIPVGSLLKKGVNLVTPDVVKNSMKEGFRGTNLAWGDVGKKGLEKQLIAGSERVSKIIKASLNRLGRLKNAEINSATGGREVLGYVDETERVLRALDPTTSSDVLAVKSALEEIGNFKKKVTTTESSTRPIRSLEYKPGAKTAEAEVIREAMDLVPDGVGASDGIFRQVDVDIRNSSPGMIPVEKTEIYNRQAAKSLNPRELDSLKMSAQSLPETYGRDFQPGYKTTPIERGVESAYKSLATDLKLALESSVGGDLGRINSTFHEIAKAAAEIPTSQQMTSAGSSEGVSIGAKEAISRFEKLIDSVPESSWSDFLSNVPERIRETLKKSKDNIKLLKSVNQKMGLNPSSVGSLVTKAANLGGVISGNASRAVGPTLEQIIPRMGKFRGVLEEAVKRGGNSLGVTHYILQSTDLEYQKLMEQENE